MCGAIVDIRGDTSGDVGGSGSGSDSGRSRSDDEQAVGRSNLIDERIFTQVRTYE